MSADAPALIAADWGTTSCRFALIGAGGTVLERATGRGILPVLADAAAGSDGPAASAAERAAVFEAELRAQAGEWLAQTPGIPVLMCGMIGSNTGWVDAGYREVPCEVVVDPADLTPVPLPGHPAWIVPGLLLPGRAPDIMRGEETQALGALLDAGDGADHLVIAPGTHSKWVRLRAGRVTGFRSYLTGELFTALREHTIIGHGIPQPPRAGGDTGPAASGDGAGAGEQGATGEVAADERTGERSAFAEGLDHAHGVAGPTGRPDAGAEPPATQTPGTAPAGAGPGELSRASLLHTVFSARTRLVAGDLDPAAVPAYLSGLLIGDEIADGLAAADVGPDTVVTVIGSADLAERYRGALARTGIAARVAGDDATLRGLLAIAEAAGWLDPAPRPGHSAEDGHTAEENA